jgi:excisionase family DNA binding protein
LETITVNDRRRQRTLLTTNDLASICGVTRPTIHAWIHDGIRQYGIHRRLKAHQIGQKFLITHEDLKMFLGDETYRALVGDEPVASH